jgi:hypothetical protein
MVWNGSLSEYYQGYIDHVFSMHMVFTSGSHTTRKVSKSIQINSQWREIAFFVRLGQLAPPFCIKSVVDFARTRIVACAMCMRNLADAYLDMFCQNKSVAHADLLTQSMFVVVCG